MQQYFVVLLVMQLVHARQAQLYRPKLRMQARIHESGITNPGKRDKQAI